MTILDFYSVERTCIVHWGGLYQPPVKPAKRSELEIAEQRRADLGLVFERRCIGRLEERKLDLAVQAQTWPMDLEIVRALVLKFNTWALNHAATRRGFSGSLEGDFFTAVRTMDSKELAGLLFEVLVKSEELDDLVDQVINSGNAASMEALKEAVEEEISAEMAKEMAEADEALAKAQLNAQTAPAAPGKKGNAK